MKPFKCSMCPERLDKNAKLKRHFNAVHEKTKSWMRFFCGVEFPEKSSLIIHETLFHSNLKLIKWALSYMI